MELLVSILPWIQIILSVILVTIIMIQQSSAGAGGAFGGGDNGAMNHTRRGFEKFLFQATIIISILFTSSILITIFI